MIVLRICHVHHCGVNLSLLYSDLIYSTSLHSPFLYATLPSLFLFLSLTDTLSLCACLARLSHTRSRGSWDIHVGLWHYIAAELETECRIPAYKLLHIYRHTHTHTCTEPIRQPKPSPKCTSRSYMLKKGAEHVRESTKRTDNLRTQCTHCTHCTRAVSIAPTVDMRSI